MTRMKPTFCASVNYTFARVSSCAVWYVGLNELDVSLLNCSMASARAVFCLGKTIDTTPHLLLGHHVGLFHAPDDSWFFRAYVAVAGSLRSLCINAVVVAQ